PTFLSAGMWIRPLPHSIRSSPASPRITQHSLASRRQENTPMGSKTVTINPKPEGGTGKASLGIQSDVAFNEAAKRLCGRDLCSIGDLTVQEVAALMELSHAVKTNPDDFRHALDGKQMVLF